MIDVKLDPTVRDVRTFGLLWLIFFVAVGGVAIWRPAGLVGASVILALAWLVSLVLNGEKRSRQVLGVFLPGLFATVGLSVRGGIPAQTVAVVLTAVGVSGALAIWSSPTLGRRVYVGWMLAAVPIGWTISHVVLGVVYYLVLTPIGLVLRLVGRDPMRRKLDRQATTYWIERESDSDPSRAFRQF